MTAELVTIPAPEPILDDARRIIGWRMVHPYRPCPICGSLAAHGNVHPASGPASCPGAITDGQVL